MISPEGHLQTITRCQSGSRSVNVPVRAAVTDRKKNHKSLVNGGGSAAGGVDGDGGSKGRGSGSSRGYGGNNLGGAGCLLTLSRPSASVLIHFG